MIRVNSVDHVTLADAAKRLGVSSKTVNEYIKRGIFPEPPRVRQGRERNASRFTGNPGKNYFL